MATSEAPTDSHQLAERFASAFTRTGTVPGAIKSTFATMAMKDPKQAAAAETVPFVLTAVADHFGITIERLTSPRKPDQLARARHVAAWFLRSTGMSFALVGAALGGRNHSTVMASCRKVEESPDLMLHARAVAGLLVQDEFLRRVAAARAPAAAEAA